MAQAYEDKLTGEITEDFWRERTDSWRAEERELRSRLKYRRADHHQTRALAAGIGAFRTPSTRARSVRYAISRGAGEAAQDSRFELHRVGGKS